MRSSKTTRGLGIRGIAVAMACTIALTGCSNLPFELPQLPELPFEMPDLSGIPNPLAGLLGGTSVEEACDEALAATPATLTADDLVEDGYLTVGIMSSTTAPMLIEGNDATVSGIDIDVASALANELGLRVRFVSVLDADQALSDGQCDVVMGVSSEDVSTSTVSGGYCENAAAFFHMGADEVATVDQLNGRTVAVQDGSVSQGVLNATALSMTQVTFSNLNEAFEALASGSVDYVLCDAYSGAYLASVYDGVSFAGSLNAPTPIGVATLPSNATLQGAVEEALATIQGNGVMDIVRANWVGGFESISVDHMVQNVPMPEVVVAEGQEGDPQDGSTAGANAATPY